jgi:hypothetical protein
MSGGWNHRAIGGGTQDERAQLCDANAAKLQHIITLKRSSYTLAQSQKSIEAEVDHRVESFMRVSIELAYQKPRVCKDRSG